MISPIIMYVRDAVCAMPRTLALVKSWPHFGDCSEIPSHPRCDWRLVIYCLKTCSRSFGNGYAVIPCPASAAALCYRLPSSTQAVIRLTWKSSLGGLTALHRARRWHSREVLDGSQTQGLTWCCKLQISRTLPSVKHDVVIKCQRTFSLSPVFPSQ